ARFIKLPPVEKSKIPDIVKYEAKQQIPFDLNDVIWSYQQVPGSLKSDAQETEIGLFAMKREHVFRAIRPLDDLGVELDIVQLMPICIYNAVTYGVLTDVPPPEEYDPQTPLPWVVVLSIGTEATDLVLTNGYRIWNRSIPLGGNHFTKQLTKEMKLTFANAEQLKRNSREAENAKEIFQAMRSVFSDLVTEVQRSMAFFRTIERSATISRVVALGNTIKLPGLQQYLAKNLGVPVDRVNSYEHLQGSEVTAAPAFEDNIAAFSVCYGLVLQGLGLGKMSTNLVPRELVVARIIRRKKPWALAAVAATLAALSFNYMFHLSRWSESQTTHYSQANSQAKQTVTLSTTLQKKDEDQKNQLEMLKQLGKQVVGNAEGRILMLELVKVINESLPRPEGVDPMAVDPLPIASGKRPEIHIEHIEMEYKTDVKEWFTEDAKKRFMQGRATSVSLSAEEASEPATTDGVPTGATDDPTAAAVETAAVAPATSEDGVPTDPGAAADGQTAADDTVAINDAVLGGRSGWIVELKCVHYHNDAKSLGPEERGPQYARNTLLYQLRSDRKITLPVPGDKAVPSREFTLEQLGIYFPLIAADDGPTFKRIANPNYVPPVDWQGAASRPQIQPGNPSAQLDAKEAKDNPQTFRVLTYTFTVQFAWIPRRLSERDEPLGAGENQTGALPPS
ncbi:MAG: pilus assembly protein PilM, partial [Planctomycetota bacterium]|nr:pilus assembly protein PilM [Planctomycetota bacterium]